MHSVRIRFTKKEAAKYISHLDLTRCLIRAFRRANIPIWYTEGFNPHPHLVFGLPLPLGVEGLRETLDIRINDDDYSDQKVLDELNRVSVPGIEFFEIFEPQLKPLAVVYGKYSVTVPNVENPHEFADKINNVIANSDVIFEKKTKKGGTKTINACEHLKDFEIIKGNSLITMNFILPAGNDFTVNPVQFCKVLFQKAGNPDILHRIVRLMLLTKDGKEFK